MIKRLFKTWTNSSPQACIEQLSILWDTAHKQPALAPLGTCVIDLMGHITSINPTLSSWLKAAEPDVLGRHYTTCFTLSSDDELLTLQGNELPYYETEITLHCLDGTSTAAHLVAFKINPEDDQGRTFCWVTLPDSSTLTGTPSNLEQLFDQLPIGIAVVDEQFHVRFCNTAFAQKFDLTPAQVSPFSLMTILPQQYHADLIKTAQALNEGKKVRSPLECTTANHVLALYINPFKNRLGPQDLVIHALDITEQKKLELQFVQSQKMQAVGQLAGGIAHDFNNLLTAMIGFCDFLLLRHLPGDQSFSDIMQIKQNANRAANLVRQLLAFSRQQTLQPRVLSLTDSLSELSALLRRLIGANIELNIKYDRNTGMVFVDQGQLEQVIINLVVNARDAMPHGGSVTIVTSTYITAAPEQKSGGDIMPPGEYVRIDVIDTGIGIPKDILPRIFEPFFSTKEVGAGTGLGLSTVYGIVQQTGGFVSVTTTLSEGTKFSIFLPRHYPDETLIPSTSAAHPATASDLTGTGRILLVEDEDAVRMFSSRALRDKGYEIIEASCGEDALEILQHQPAPIDILITDVMMPRMDGPTLATHVRQKYPNVKLIFISGYTEDAFRSRLSSEDNIHFLPKPFTLKDLAQKVKDIL